MKFIKVCGIQNLQEAQMCADLGVTHLGFLVGITHQAEDKITQEDAKNIISEISGVETVMVTHLLDYEKIAEIAKDINVTTIQIHDDLDIDGIINLKKALPNVTLIKAVHVENIESIEKAKKYEELSELSYLLLDSRTKDRLGGTGKTHDWNISKAIVEKINKPVILAGGLNENNIKDAISTVNPAGIDANSGVENDDGSKNLKKVKAFVSA